uniref:Uncharacterized protein n=1 Tax=Chenopodium quinoa TaxID=63459 RepID=A0A803MD28_CHEQI
MDSKSNRGDESVVAEVKNSSDKPVEEANDKQKCSLSNLTDLGSVISFAYKFVKNYAQCSFRDHADEVNCWRLDYENALRSFMYRC